MDRPSFLETNLNGLFKPDFVAKGRVMMKIDGSVDGGQYPFVRPLIRIHNARDSQAQKPVFSEEAFFEEHGFVLMAHETAVSDWDKDASTPYAENQIAHTYLPEIESIIRTRLLPGKTIEVQQSPGSLLRRGPGTPNAFYGSGAHQDFGLTADDYQESLEAFTTPQMAQMWRSQYERPEVEGFMMVDFWRTVYLKKPLEHMPLAVLDPNTVRTEDTVPVGLVDFAPTGKPTNQMSLRFDKDQKWYYYPRMTSNEVMAFKIFQCFKSDKAPRLQTCFHSAFDAPETPKDVEERQSCEHRAGIFILNS